MSEHSVISRTPVPQTRDSLANDLRALGVKPHMTLMVHVSLSSLGWVNGGAVALVQALMDVATPEGTIIFQTHSGNLTDPKHWGNPPAPEDWWETIRQTMPAFEPDITPSYRLGVTPEVFRSFPDVKRSNHPTVSMAAWGKHAEWLTDAHQLDFSLGEGSPLKKLYDLDGQVLLIGVGHDSNTSFHLAEYRCGKYETVEKGSPILEDGKQVWKVYQDIEIDTDRFEAIGADFEKAHDIVMGKVGLAPCKLFRMREAVDFAEEWLRRSL